MLPPANIAALIAATQASHANALDLIDTCIDSITVGVTDRPRLYTQLHRTQATSQPALASTVCLLTSFLAAAAVDLAQVSADTPADIVADWRQQTARAVDLAEANLNGETL